MMLFISEVRTCGNMKRTLIERKVAWRFSRIVGWVVSDAYLADMVRKAGEHAVELEKVHPHCDKCHILFMPPACLKIGRHCEVKIRQVTNIINS